MGRIGDSDCRRCHRSLAVCAHAHTHIYICMYKPKRRFFCCRRQLASVCPVPPAPGSSPGARAPGSSPSAPGSRCPRFQSRFQSRCCRMVILYYKGVWSGGGRKRGVGRRKRGVGRKRGVDVRRNVFGVARRLEGRVGIGRSPPHRCRALRGPVRPPRPGLLCGPGGVGGAAGAGTLQSHPPFFRPLLEVKSSSMYL